MPAIEKPTEKARAVNNKPNVDAKEVERELGLRELQLPEAAAAG